MSTLKEILTRWPVAATIRLTVPAGGARPAPPVGPALGQYRLNLMAFCKDFNARTQKYKPDGRDHHSLQGQHLRVHSQVPLRHMVPQRRPLGSSPAVAGRATRWPPPSRLGTSTRSPRSSSPTPIASTCPWSPFGSPSLGPPTLWGLRLSRNWIDNGKVLFF
ncbi:hypothetical protein FH972_011699 [Carpinus fangiana]|uniref:Large ribosomal subunit protein uL11m n=1 Tax=Carpinus fangiana TaxID=176857 RepID=A0A660KTX1_9ROSI|nr:hypothetical protein FH972_011699 [Carpinus fangiana]